MHRTNETLLNSWKLDVLLVATFTFHTGRDTTDDDDGIHVGNFLGEVVKLDELAFADVTTQHREVTIAVLVLNHDVVSLASLHWERLVVGAATSEAEAEATTTAALRLFYDVAIHLEHIAVIGREGVLHITREGSLVLTRKTYRKRVLADALSKAPSTEGGEVQFVVVACNSWLAAETVVVEELSLNALATVELLQVMDGGVAVRKFAGLSIEDFRVRQRILDTLEERVLVSLRRCATIVTVEQLHIVGIRT